jgi:hypothetical protein
LSYENAVTECGYYISIFFTNKYSCLENQIPEQQKDGNRMKIPAGYFSVHPMSNTSKE